MSLRNQAGRLEAMKILVVANQKGGVGKTSLVLHLTWVLSEIGRRVLVIDLDPQGNLSWCLKRLSDETLCPAAAVFEKEEVHAERIAENIWLTASNIKLARYEAMAGGVNIYFRLRRALQKFRKEHPLDHVIIDCPPSLGLFSLSALVAGESLVIPMRTEVFSVAGLGDLLNIVDEVRENINPNLSIAGLVLNAVSSRTRVAQNTLNELSEITEELGLPILSVIPATVKMEEALREGLPVWQLKSQTPLVKKIRSEFQQLIEKLR